MMRRLTARLASRDVGPLSVILAGALGIRLLGAGRGLPYIHGEGPSTLWYVIGMLQHGIFNLGVWLYPSVYYGMLLPVVYLHYWYLHAHGMLSSLRDIQLSDPQALTYWWYLNPASFYLWGRVLNDLVGAATVFLVYRIGKTAYGTTEGLLAAALLALAPGAIYYANVINQDIPMDFFVTLTVLVGWGIIRRGRWQDYLLAGLFAGLAIATESIAVIVILTLLIAHLVSPHRTRLLDLRLSAMGLCVLAGVVIGTPYVLITPDAALHQMRDQALGYGGVPSLTSIREVLPGYLAYFVRPSQDTWLMVPHAAMGLLPAAFALLGAVAGFRWDCRLHLYLLSFPLTYFLFTLGRPALVLQHMISVLPFATLFAAAGCIWAWRLFFQTRWPAADASWTRGLAGMALVTLLAVPGRDAAVLGWTLGRRPDTRTAAIEWLRQHVPPGARIALEKELRWYLPGLDGLPFTPRFAPRDAKLAWYRQQHIDFAVVGELNPLRSLPAVKTFPRPTYLYAVYGKGWEHWPQDSYPVIDPTLYIIRPKMPEINAVFPVEVDASDMILEPIVTDAVGVYSEIVHLPAQRFTPGSYILAVAGEWPRLWKSLNFKLTKLTATVRVGQMIVDKVTLNGAQPLGFATPAFRIDQAQTLPVQVGLLFWIEQQQTPGQRDRPGWALRPSATGCAIVPITSRNVWKLDLQQMTLEAWVYPEDMNKPAGGGESEGPILGKGKHLGYYLRLIGDPAGKIFADLSVAGKFSVGRAGFVPLRKWTHIAATYDGHEAQIYLNGAPVPPERNSHYEDTVHAKGYPLIIGCRDPGPDQAVFNGFITGVRIWNRVLSAEDLRIEASQRYLPDTSAGLVGSWSFQSLVNGMILDLSRDGNNLNAKTLERVPIESGPAPTRPVWTSGQNLLRTVRIERVMP